MLATKDLPPAAVLDFKRPNLLACLREDGTPYGEGESNGLLLARHVLAFVAYPAALAPSLAACLEPPTSIYSIRRWARDNLRDIDHAMLHDNNNRMALVAVIINALQNKNNMDEGGAGVQAETREPGPDNARADVNGYNNVDGGNRVVGNGNDSNMAAAVEPAAPPPWWSAECEECRRQGYGRFHSFLRHLFRPLFRWRR
ncbi:hypothetical protein SLS64_003524 [Diaporthe eres]|uniref:Uncharacterized protein n=1 Tax=Diaporthe eres TaxID=83184 RepID=A0ABR1PCL1_DIAER